MLHSKYIFKHESEICFFELLNPFFSVMNNVFIILFVFVFVFDVVDDEEDIIIFIKIQRNGYNIEDCIEFILHNISDKVDNFIISLFILLLLLLLFKGILLSV